MNENKGAFQLQRCRISAIVSVVVALTIHHVGFSQQSKVFWLQSGFITNRAGGVIFTTNQSVNAHGQLITDEAKREVIKSLFSSYDNPTNGTFTITVSLNTNAYRLGDEITAKVALKNEGGGQQVVSELVPS